MQKRQLSDRAVIIGSIVGLVVLVLLCTLLSNFLTNIAAWMPILAGAILLIGNRNVIAEIIRTRSANTVVFNLMVGLALILFGLGTTFFGQSGLRIVLFLPGLLLLGIALPMALNKPSITAYYRSWMSAVMGVVRRKAEKTTANAAPPATTIDLEAGMPIPPGINFDPSIYTTPKDSQQR